MATFDCEVVQAVTVGEDIGALPAPHHESSPDVMAVEGIGSAEGGGAELIRDIPRLVREIP